jgi:hypothetical protein
MPLSCGPEAGSLPILPAGEFQGWCKYVNEAYGFSFLVPPDWGLCERYEHFIRLCTPSSPTVFLTIGFRRTTEDAEIQRTGLGAGEVVEGKIGFLGQDISRDTLVYEGKDKSVLYQNATEIEVATLVFTLSLDDTSTDYDSVALPEDVQSMVDKIVETFELMR